MSRKVKDTIIIKFNDIMNRKVKDIMNRKVKDRLNRKVKDRMNRKVKNIISLKEDKVQMNSNKSKSFKLVNKFQAKYQVFKK